MLHDAGKLHQLTSDLVGHVFQVEMGGKKRLGGVEMVVRDEDLDCNESGFYLPHCTLGKLVQTKNLFSERKSKGDLLAKVAAHSLWI